MNDLFTALNKKIEDHFKKLDIDRIILMTYEQTGMPDKSERGGAEMVQAIQK